MSESTFSADTDVTPGRSSVQSILRNYVAPAGNYDEVRAQSGELRSHWKNFCNATTDISVSEFSRRWSQSRRLMHENGLAYSAYGDRGGWTRPWELDPLPLLIRASEWEVVSRGLAQRASLLNRLLADLFGPQESIKGGALPADALLRHPGFLRPYWGQKMTERARGPEGSHHENNGYLQFYAADLARSRDGSWWVLGDRTEAPSGSGFALENRIVISRLLPEAFRRCRVERLAPYFLTVQETLRRLAVHHRDNPRVILLSQGPESPNYFEDAYLARYLGYTLAHGDDLAVRNNHVHLKTLGGLLPIDVIMRRPNSRHCDPLELAPDTTLGSAGLLQASRTHSVVVANGLGSGLVESPMIMAFLPAICEMLLGEKLLLPGVPTWWCGETRHLPFIFEHLDSLVIRPAYRERGAHSEEARKLIGMSKADLAELIRHAPAKYVAQQQIERSTVPVVRTDATRAIGYSGASPEKEVSWGESLTTNGAYCALRAFAVAHEQGFTVMTGGLGRITHSLDPHFVSLATGEGSKDVWILADRPVKQVSLLTDSAASVTLRRSGAELPSRVADHVYWLGRNLERADANARLLRTLLQRMTSESAVDDLQELPTLLRVLAEQGQIEPGYMVDEIRETLPRLELQLPRSILDEQQSTSLRSMVRQMVRVAAAVRDRISVDSWRIIHRVEQAFRPLPHAVSLADILSMINEVIIDLAAISGMVMESMTRTHTWRFLDLGRRLERALQTTSLISIAFSQPDRVGGQVFEAILEVSDSIMTYRSRYLANLQLPAVLDLLLTDESNPRSVAYQLVAITQHVDALPRDVVQAEYAREQRLAMAILHTVRMMDVSAAAEAYALGDAKPLHEILDSVSRLLPELSDTVSHRYLIHAGPTHQLLSV